MADKITDADGRVLTVREMGIREKMKMIRQLGQASDIQVWFGQVILATSVTEIDGIPVIIPATADQADVVVERVGSAGQDAVAQWWLSRRETPEIDKERAKNFAGTPTS